CCLLVTTVAGRGAVLVAEISAGELRGTVAPAAWRKRRWLLIAVVVGVVALFGLLFWGLRRGPSAPVGVTVPLSRSAPDFTVAAHQVTYPVALDPHGSISSAVGITGVPETFLIDPQGRLTQKFVGPITARQLSGLLAPMVP